MHRQRPQTRRALEIVTRRALYSTFCLNFFFGMFLVRFQLKPYLHAKVIQIVSCDENNAWQNSHGTIESRLSRKISIEQNKGDKLIKNFARSSE